MLNKENLQDIYPLSPMQAGMLFHALYDKASRAYNLQHAFRILGDIDVSAVEASYQALLKRHEALRSVFVFKNVPEPLQLVLKTQNIDFHFEDLPQQGIIEAGEQKQYLQTYKQKDLERSFDLSKDTLLRLGLFRLGTSAFEFIWTNHHIILDGWSLGIILQEFFDWYFALVEGKEQKLMPTVPYKRYINWLKSQNKDQAREYWENYLTGYERLATLNHNPVLQPENPPYLAKEWVFELDEKITAQLNQLLVQHSMTLSTVIQTLWGILLSKYTQLDDVVFGSVVSGRPEELQGIEQMVGLFINTVPIRIQTVKTENVSELLQRVQKQILLSHQYDYYPLADIQACSPLKQQLLDHLIVIENYPLDESIKENFVKFSKGTSLENVEAVDDTHYDFTFMLTLFGDHLRCHFLYNGHIYDEPFMQTLSDYFIRIAEQIAFNPTIKLGDIEMLSAQEQAEMAARKTALEQINKSLLVAEFDF